MAKRRLGMLSLAAAALFVAMAFLIACAQTPATPTPSEPTGTLSFREETLKLDQLGKASELSVSVGDTEVYGAEFSSSNEEVAIVVGNAVIATGDGNAVITAEYGGQEASCIVTVETQATVVIEGDAVRNVALGGTVQLSASVKLPSVFDTDAGVTWSSNDEKVATVDENGLVTALQTGIAQITAESNYQITTTETSTVMGMQIESTEEKIASATVTLLIGNEYDASVHTNIAGTYEGHYDWQGFAEQASAENPCYTQDNFLWIRSKIVLTLHEDGSFYQEVLNAQRASYPDEIDMSLPESTYEEQIAKYGTTNCYVYNRYEQRSDAEEFAGEMGKVFANIDGMTAAGMNNFAESGYYMVLDGKLVLFYGKVNGFTGEYESTTFVWGDVEDSAFVQNAYVPFTNLVAMNENMTQKLTKTN